ncbi:MAG: magnesium transporter, partial [Candidatus Nanohaloarchaea archaeon]|nr:magnesium transporter [Candidatus Nanohaloarchaea archaeon]
MAEKHEHIGLADTLQNRPPEEAAQELQNADLDTAVRALQETRPHRSADILEHLDISYSTDIISHLPPDDATDVIGELRHKFRIQVLSRLEEEDATDIIQLLKYHPETAGGLMTTDFISFPADTTVSDAINTLRDDYETAETVYYAYIVEDGVLKGTVSLKELTLADRDAALGDIMETDLENLPTDMDREEVVRIFDKHHYQAMPVVEDGTIRGIITFDDVIDVMREEATEDVQKIAGGSGHEEVFSRWTYKVRKRAPWLYLNLIPAFGGAAVVSLFESTIAQIAILAAFLPVINNQAGNVGLQALSVTIRGLATGEMDYERLMTATSKELLTGITNGLLIGATIGVIAYLWQSSYMLGVVIFSSMMVTIIVANLAGFLVPITLDRLGYDPASASSIFVTAIADISGIFFMLG